MDHAEVRDRLADALLAPGGLDTLRFEGDPEAAALREHLAACPSCRREADALAATGTLLALAAPDDLAAPLEARERVLAAVREQGRLRPTASRVVAAPGAVAPAAEAPARWRWLGLPRWAAPLAAVAAAVVLVAGLALAMDLAAQRDRAQRQLAAVAEVASASSQILATADHDTLALTTSEGARGGTVLYSPSSGQLVVWGRGLDSIEPGERYDCYVVHEGATLPVGYMRLAGELAYWVGWVEPGTPLGVPGDQFLVVSSESGATPILSGTF